MIFFIDEPVSAPMLNFAYDSSTVNNEVLCIFITYFSTY